MCLLLDLNPSKYVNLSAVSLSSFIAADLSSTGCVSDQVLKYDIQIIWYLGT